MNFQIPSTLYFQNYLNIPFYNALNYVRPIYQNFDPRFKTQAEQVNSALQFSDHIAQKTDDELWIETYLSKIGKININLHSNVEVISQKPVTLSTSTNKKYLSIHVANTVLHRCIVLLRELEKLEECLRTNMATMSSTEWKQKSLEIGQQKDEFTSLVSQFDDGVVLDHLNRLIKARKKKRISQKRKKIAQREKNKEMSANRQKQHKKIDNWLESMKESAENAKKSESLKMDVDCVLSEVTKKKWEARRQLSTLAALVKLRSVREQASAQRGERISLQDANAFKLNTEKLQKMWEQALNKYTIEEQELRKTLENKAADGQAELTNQWTKVLFGSDTDHCPAYWGLTCADKDLGTFIALRRSWDTFLVEGNKDVGSKIPVGWVLPDPGQRDCRWTQYLQTDKTLDI